MWFYQILFFLAGKPNEFIKVFILIHLGVLKILFLREHRNYLLFFANTLPIFVTGLRHGIDLVINLHLLFFEFFNLRVMRRVRLILIHILPKLKIALMNRLFEFDIHLFDIFNPRPASFESRLFQTLCQISTMIGSFFFEPIQSFI